MAKPIICIMGGFLGAGKSSLIRAAMKRTREIGLNASYVANDQGRDLVDAHVACQDVASASVRFVGGGCFCCRFDELLVELDALRAQGRADIVFTEAVGSCTDISATVLNPLRAAQGYEWSFAPLTIVTEPDCVRDMLIEPSPNFSQDMKYLFSKQLEEADLVLLNKVDGLPDAQIDACEQAVRGVNPVATVVRTSAVSGSGVDEWLREMARPRPAGRLLLDLDYGRYGAAEREMTWFDARYTIRPRRPGTTIRLQQVLQKAGDRIGIDCTGVHLKGVLAGSRGRSWGAVTMSKPTAAVQAIGEMRTGPWTLLVNARAIGSPEAVREAVEGAVAAVAAAAGCGVREISSVAFRPSFPEPTHRFLLPVLAG